MFESTEIFNKEVIKINRPIGSIEDETEFSWCIGVVLEELKELKDAHDEKDFIKEIDAVIDLLYFVSGFMTRMGIPHHLSQQMFNAVHSCNMNKKKGKKDREITHDNDAVKPEGWEGPEKRIMEILNAYENRN